MTSKLSYDVLEKDGNIISCFAYEAPNMMGKINSCLKLTEDTNLEMILEDTVI